MLIGSPVKLMSVSHLGTHLYSRSICSAKEIWGCSRGLKRSVISVKNVITLRIATFASKELSSLADLYLKIIWHITSKGGYIITSKCLKTRVSSIF